MVEVCGTSDGHTLDSRDSVRLEGSNPDGPFLCELAPSILIIIRVKRGSSLSLIALADMARGKAKTDPRNTAKQQRYSQCWRCTHTHTHPPHTHTVSCVTIKINLKHRWRHLKNINLIQLLLDSTNVKNIEKKYRQTHTLTHTCS